MRTARKRRRWFEDFQLEILEPRILPAVVVPTSSSYPSLVAVGDFNGDGRPDVVDLDPAAGTASVYLNDPRSGTAPRSPFDPPIVISGLKQPDRVAAEDFNGDGKLDLAIASTGPDGPGIIGIYLGRGDGTFEQPRSSGPDRAMLRNSPSATSWATAWPISRCPTWATTRARSTS